ncbi:MAG TPA: NAD(P)-binding domain-containing protein [Gemmatimonas sp.]|uniref:NAD(P)-binding domain-containing protein n=1 Tax=Gemmatimonas sp. TaxID=1962908 RepID=UPI002ED7CEA3
MFLLPFHVIGVSHAANSAERVGRLRLSVERTDELLAALRARESSAVLLSTCHRTELYWWGEEELGEWFVTEVIGDTSNVRIDRVDADLAVRHLFSVASGMQSVRYGEPEILGQVRRSWIASREAGTACGPIDALFRQSIDAARHIRAAMGSEGDPTLGDRVVERMAAHRRQYDTGSTEGACRVLVIGSGDAARSTLEALRAADDALLPSLDISVTSRTDERAATIAERFGVATKPWEHRAGAVQQADVVIFAAHVTSPLIAPDFAPFMPERAGRALWIDLGVPGAVSTEFEAAQVDVVPLKAIAGVEAPLLQVERTRRASSALQHELDRYARATHRLQLGARLGALEERAVAAAIAHGDASAEGVARRVTRLVLRELTRA